MSSGVYIPGGRNDWATPPDLFAAINRQFGPLTLDVCATGDNTKCPAYIGAAVNGLTQGWDDGWFCNPPYTVLKVPVVGQWVEKAVTEAALGHSGAMLLSNDPSTEWFDNVRRHAETIAFLVGPRVRFIDPTGDSRVAPTITNIVAHFTPRGAAHQRVVLWDWRNEPLNLSEEDFDVSLGRIARLTTTNESLFERLQEARRENMKLRKQLTGAIE